MKLYPPIGQPLDHALDLAGGETAECQGGQVSPACPGWGELLAKRVETIEPRRRDMVHHEAEELYRGGIDPVQIFHNQEDRVVRRRLH
jgi:hypothetical protein